MRDEVVAPKVGQARLRLLRIRVGDTRRHAVIVVDAFTLWVAETHVHLLHDSRRVGHGAVHCRVERVDTFGTHLVHVHDTVDCNARHGLEVGSAFVLEVALCRDVAVLVARDVAEQRVDLVLRGGAHVLCGHTVEVNFEVILKLLRHDRRLEARSWEAVCLHADTHGASCL